MSNEIMLILSVLLVYGSVLVWYWLFGEKGLFCFNVLATIAANIEVLIIVDAFGMEQTLGNILFASTFLVTDILSEVCGKKSAKSAVNVGILTSVTFILISQSWLLYTPNANDFAMPSIEGVFSNTPRMMLAGLIVYAIVQKIDVWAYHKWWNYTSVKFKNKRKYLWIRNNGSTLFSQFLNAILFTFAAFWGIYDFKTLMNITFSSYVIFIVTSLVDTPFIYFARLIHEKRHKIQE